MSGPNGEKCSDCYFWGCWEVRNKAFAYDSCRKQPPQLVPYLAGKPIYLGPDELVDDPTTHINEWPITEFSDWCGEFKKRESNDEH